MIQQKQKSAAILVTAKIGADLRDEAEASAQKAAETPDLRSKKNMLPSPGNSSEEGAVKGANFGAEVARHHALLVDTKIKKETPMGPNGMELLELNVGKMDS